MVVVGPLAGGILAAMQDLSLDRRPDLWVVSELPIESNSIPPAFLESLDSSHYLIVAEEHSAHGGAGQMLAHRLLEMGKAPARFTHRAARGYSSGRYGSQKFHRAECGLDAASLTALVEAA